MSKPRKVFTCTACGSNYPQWMGKCPGCGEWNTLVEEIVEKTSVRSPERRKSVPVAYDGISSEGISRKTTGIDELNRVLGGGIVKGSLVLVGGDPGVGKSTIMLQMASSVSVNRLNVLYVSGEESASQLKIRGDRLGVDGRGIVVYAEVVMERIVEQVKLLSPDLVIMDSIQSVYSSNLDAPPGSMSQIRHCAGVCMEIAKGSDIPVFIIGHVTKEGWIAGPKMLEHMVDTVLYFEGQNTGAYRVLRAVKNRFGPAGEIGVFEMKESGLEQVADPSGVFVNSSGMDSSGSAIMATIEGSRAFVVEVQSLVSQTSFSMPKRISMGVDPSRLSVLLAVMEKRSSLSLSSSDVVVNIAGGIRVNEPALDLAVVLSVASSARDRVIPSGVVSIGEVGLNGEIRPTGNMEARIREARRMGFTRALLPDANKESLPQIPGMDMLYLRHITEALELLDLD